MTKYYWKYKHADNQYLGKAGAHDELIVRFEGRGFADLFYEYEIVEHGHAIDDYERLTILSTFRNNPEPIEANGKTFFELADEEMS